MVVFVFALQIAAFSSRTFLIQLDIDSKLRKIRAETPKNVRYEHPCLNHQSLETIVPLA